MTAKATNAEIAGRRDRFLQLLKTNANATFSDVLEIYPPVAFAREFDLRHNSFPAKMETPENIKVYEIIKIAAGLSLPAARIFQLVNASVQTTEDK